MNRGKIYVIAAPSGAGKSTLVNALCKLDSNVQLSISHTTRGIRPGEEHGVNYFFTSIDDFKNMIDKNEFLEYAEVYGNMYGTNITTIKDFLATGKDILLEIDWQGARQIRKLFNDAVLIFIAPPSLEILEKRLRDRKTDSQEVIEKRLALAREDMAHAAEFDYIIINDDFDTALQDLCSIIRAGRNKTARKLEIIKQKFDLNSGKEL
ncbi:guanylate kinase [Aquella oligotrophica]|uniref:Guanylate kinase n=1 Tax=Aquella oligotrophica TaxID=2067065 RepID=A0A2I7N7X2_9NEIS|nr:guanylate kinase [Aquella oligotrophica]AUR52551.1 guanylate kinase [Aquella oligotrophica]